MKLNIKTQFWDSEDVHDWRERYNKLFKMVLLESAIILMIMLEPEFVLAKIVAYVIAIPSLAISIIIYISYSKWDGERWKQKRKKEKDT